MGDKIHSGVKFKFTVPNEGTGTIYTYTPRKGVTGGHISDPIVYTTARVDQNLKEGRWIVVGEKLVFPRSGIHARLDSSMKVFVVGLAEQPGHWVVEVNSGPIFKVRTSQLSEIFDEDAKAFAIMDDLKITYQQAKQMVKKGYGKL
jgi:hypothetical protein